MSKSRNIYIKRGTHSICSVPGCGRKHHSHGFCGKHSHKYIAYGGPLASRGPDKGAVLQFIQDVALACKDDECLVWPFSTDGHGYGQFHKGGKPIKAHRYVCMLAHGEPPSPAHEAAHSCGKGHLGCCNPNHLRWATHQENETDKLVHGTHKRGCRHHNVKLTEREVLEIMQLKGCMSQRELASRYGVQASAIASIHAGKTWSWLTGRRLWPTRRAA